MVFSFDRFVFDTGITVCKYNAEENRKLVGTDPLRVVLLFVCIFKALNVPRDRLLFFLLVVALTRHSGYCTLIKE